MQVRRSYQPEVRRQVLELGSSGGAQKPGASSDASASDVDGANGVQRLSPEQTLFHDRTAAPQLGPMATHLLSPTSVAIILASAPERDAAFRW